MVWRFRRKLLWSIALLALAIHIFGDGIVGQIDELRIWRAARTEEEILTWEPRILSGFKDAEEAGPAGDIAIVGRVDMIESRTDLMNLALPIPSITGDELLDPATYDTYRAIFFPCLCEGDPSSTVVQDNLRQFVQGRRQTLCCRLLAFFCGSNVARNGYNVGRGLWSLER